MQLQETPLQDAYIIDPQVYGDDRGFFMETWKENAFKDAGIDVTFIQDNHSKSAKGVLRGLHFQTKKPQVKLVRVVVGSVYDVIVDCRSDSPSYGKSFGIVLSAKNKRQLYVPEGFAHGFLSLEEGTEFLYKVSDVYDPDGEGGLMRNDPAFNIQREKYFTEFGIEKPLLSEKDGNYESFKNFQSPFLMKKNKQEKGVEQQ